MELTGIIIGEKYPIKINGIDCEIIWHDSGRIGIDAKDIKHQYEIQKAIEAIGKKNGKRK